MHFDLTKNNMGALNNEGLPKIWNPGNLKLQTRNCKVQFAFCGFPWKIWCLRCLSNFRLVFCTYPGESCKYEQRRHWERHISRPTRRRRHYPQFAAGNIELRDVQKESRWFAFFPISAELRHNCFLCVSRPYSYSDCILEIQVITQFQIIHMRSLFFVTVYFSSKCGLFYFRLYSYGNGRIGVFESRFLEVQDFLKCFCSTRSCDLSHPKLLDTTYKS